METDKKDVSNHGQFDPTRSSVCLYDTSCSTTAAASGSKSASFHAKEVDTDPVVFSTIDLIPQSGRQLLATVVGQLRRAK